MISERIIHKSRHIVGWAGKPPYRERVTVNIEIRETPKGPELSVTEEVTDSHYRMVAFGAGLTSTRQVGHHYEGWNAALVSELVDVADRWHLNSMRAGCEHQRAMGWGSCPGHHVGTVRGPCNGDADAGKLDPTSGRQLDYCRGWPVCLKPGRGHIRAMGSVHCGKWGAPIREDCREDMLGRPCPECGYRYGSAWLYESLPEEVIAFVTSLPK